MTARDLPPSRCRGQLRLPLAPERPALPDPVDVAAVFDDLERLEIDMDYIDDGGDQ